MLFLFARTLLTLGYQLFISRYLLSVENRFYALNMLLFDFEHLRLIRIPHRAGFRLRLVQDGFQLRQLGRRKFEPLLHFRNIAMASGIWRTGTHGGSRIIAVP